MTNASTTQEPSSCEVQCKSQQAALTKCMNAIRDARETITNTDDDDDDDDDYDDDNDNDNNDISRVDTKCLAWSVAAWTDCCSKANNGEVVSNEGHIGIE
mmetsp:Transcript_13007/g.26075  ORF Transcript_13007/g.26075 Transcript_13007/m.26075 type:complete len:100 (-) Transcript_13007:474-773(-)